MTGSDRPGRVGKKEWLRKKIIPIFTLLLVIAVSVILFVCARNPEIIASLENYRYLGAFLISLIGNATVLLPGIVLPILSGMGIVFYPVTGVSGPIMVGLAGGVGAGIGEIVGYMAGCSGRSIVVGNKRYEGLTGWVKRWGALAIFVLSLAPLFFDLVGIAAGVIRFPLWKFVLVCWLGRTILYVAFVVLAAMGWGVVLPYFG